MIFQPLKMAKVAEATPCGWKMTFTKKYRYLTWKNRQKVWFQPLRAVIFTDLNILMQWATNGKNWESTTNWIFASNLELKSQVKWGKKLSNCNFPIFVPAPQIFFLALFSLHYQNLGGLGGVFKVMERRKYIDISVRGFHNWQLFLLYIVCYYHAYLVCVQAKMHWIGLWFS